MEVGLVAAAWAVAMEAVSWERVEAAVAAARLGAVV